MKVGCIPRLRIQWLKKPNVRGKARSCRDAYKRHRQDPDSQSSCCCPSSMLSTRALTHSSVLLKAPYFSADNVI